MNKYYKIGKEKIHYEQMLASNELLRHQYMGDRRNCVFAPTQSGKTGVIIDNFDKFKKFEPNVLSVLYNHKPETTGRDQNGSRLADAFDIEGQKKLVLNPKMLKHVSLQGAILPVTYCDFYANHTEIMVDKILEHRNNGGAINIISDESHHALKEEGKVKTSLLEFFGIDLARHHIEWENHRIWHTSVSATPNSEILALIKGDLNRRLFEPIAMQPGDGYVGVQDILDSESFVNMDGVSFWDEKANDINPWLKEEMLRWVSDWNFGYIPFRSTSKKQHDVLKAFCQEIGLTYDIVGSGPSAKDTTQTAAEMKEELKYEPDKLILKIMDQGFSAGDTLEDKYMKAYVDFHPTTGETFTQRCRFTGYGKNRDCKIYALGRFLREAAEQCKSFQREVFDEETLIQSSAHNTGNFSMTKGRRIQVSKDDRGKVKRTVSLNNQVNWAAALPEGRWRTNEENNCLYIDEANPNYREDFEKLIEHYNSGGFETDDGQTSSEELFNQGYKYVHPVPNEEVDMLIRKEAHHRSTSIF